MTEMVNGAPESTSYSSGQLPVTPSSQPASSQVHEEKTFKQSEVNDLVGRAKHEAVERYKREASMASRENYQQPNYGVPPHQQQPVRGEPQFNGMSEAEFRRMAAEEAQRLRDEWVADTHRSAQEQEANRMATEFFTKLDAGKAKYNDFDAVVKEVDFAAIPNIVQLANMVDNTPDVMYELAKNPAKIANIQQLVSISPKLALSEMRRLAQSIKTNEEAAKFKAPNEPLSQMRPSNTSTDSNGALTVADYKRKYRV